jgi:hypothetical protein
MPSADKICCWLLAKTEKDPSLLLAMMGFFVIE